MRVQPGLGRPSIITPEIQAIIDQEMEKDLFALTKSNSDNGNSAEADSDTEGL